MGRSTGKAALLAGGIGVMLLLGSPSTASAEPSPDTPAVVYASAGTSPSPSRVPGFVWVLILGATLVGLRSMRS